MWGLGGRRIWVVDMFIAMHDEDELVRETALLLLERLPVPEKRTKEDLRRWWRRASPDFFD